MASRRSICSIARRTGATAAVRPSAMPSARVETYWSTRVGYAASRASSLLEALRRVARLVLRHLGRPDLRARHVVEGELVLLRGQRLEMVLADERQQVTGDDLLGLEPVGADVLRLGQRGAERGLVGRTAVRAEIGPAVVVALIAEDRGGQRVALREFPPRIGRRGRSRRHWDRRRWARARRWPPEDGVALGWSQSSATG